MSGCATRSRIEIPLRDVFEAPTSRRLRSGSRCGEPVAGRAVARSRARELQSGPLPLSLAQRRLWFLSRFGARQYHVSAAVRLLGTLDRTALDRAVFARSCTAARVAADVVPIARRRSRTAHRDAARPSHSTSSICVASRRESRETACAARLLDMRRRPFDLETGPLFRCALVRWRRHTRARPRDAPHRRRRLVDRRDVAGAERALRRHLPRRNRRRSPEPELQYSDFAVVAAGVDSERARSIEGQLWYWRAIWRAPRRCSCRPIVPGRRCRRSTARRTTALYSAI